MYRIAWRMIATGVTGHGDYCLTLEVANAWITSLQKEYPDMIHWIEEEDGDVVMEMVG